MTKKLALQYLAIQVTLWCIGVAFWWCGYSWTSVGCFAIQWAGIVWFEWRKRR